MSDVGTLEIATQKETIQFFTDRLGYEFLGNWRGRENNRNIDKGRLKAWLKSRGVEAGLAGKALRALDKAASLGAGRSLHSANRAVYGLLRYGAKVKPKTGEHKETVWFIDWEHPERNEFGIAEEVTVKGKHDRRPDLVLYVNGIALGVLELKRSSISVGEGVRQNIGNQKSEFIRPFFTTVQLVMAGNETEGLRYGVTGTPEKYWLRWREDDAHPATGGNPLLRELGQLCGRERLLEIVHDFMVFDAGVKKTCRHNQYFGVKAAQERVRRREGGIIWHTQGSGKSLIMVWLAKWILENVAGARVLVVTDRTELDEQIEKVFKGVHEDIYRTHSGADLVQVLDSPAERLVCSLIHKFGGGDELGDKDVDAFIADIERKLPKNFRPKGEFFVFVDECHRTQSGTLHKALKKLLPEAMIIGFTGTPLLKKDKATSKEIFGSHIHTYKYDEAVRDKVVLDLRYEARDIDQSIASPEKIDQWFEAKTKGLSDIALGTLKKRWGTMHKLHSAKSRLEKIVADILLDMETRDRLMSNHGNALLVAGSIYSACRFYELFQGTPLAGKCAVVTSYQPNIADIKGSSGESDETKAENLKKFAVYRKMLAAYFEESEDAAMHKAEQFEREVKKLFVEEPGRMKLLVVVDKLLTGFDAPSATYLYIDKHMQDHGLFQAICRVNRLDGEDKEYGYIIDYMDLFMSLEKAINDYTGGAFERYDKEDVPPVKPRLEKGRENLETARETVKALCEAVPPPKDTAAHIEYFGPGEDAGEEERRASERKRVLLYKSAASLVRAYANLANDMDKAGYSKKQIREVKAEVAHFEKVREEVKLSSGDYVDMKMFEPAMRHLLDTYVQASDSRKLADFDDMTLVELIVKSGLKALEQLPEDIRKSRKATAETIEENIRKVIVDEMAGNPAYYMKMSELLEALVAQRRKESIDYKKYLKKIVALARDVQAPETGASYPKRIKSAALRALYDNIEEGMLSNPDVTPSYGGEKIEDPKAALAVALDEAIRDAAQADWRGNKGKEKLVRNAIRMTIFGFLSLAKEGDDEEEFEKMVETFFNLAAQQHEY